MSITTIYKTFFELQIKYTTEFCKNVEKILTPTHTGGYIQKMYLDMEKELDSILETNKDYYDEWFNMEYKNIDSKLSKLNLDTIEDIKLFILSYTSTFKSCLDDFLNIPNNDFCKNLVNDHKSGSSLDCASLTFLNFRPFKSTFNKPSQL